MSQEDFIKMEGSYNRINCLIS